MSLFNPWKLILRFWRPSDCFHSPNCSQKQLLFWFFPDNVCVCACHIPTSLPARPLYVVRTWQTPIIWNTPTSRRKALSDFDSKVLFLDLDQVIVGPLDALVAYQGPLALLHTDTIACELASGGYNSSVISWWLGIGQWLADIDPWYHGNLMATPLMNATLPPKIRPYWGILKGSMVVNRPLIKQAISWGGWHTDIDTDAHGFFHGHKKARVWHEVFHCFIVSPNRTSFFFCGGWLFIYVHLFMTALNGAKLNDSFINWWRAFITSLPTFWWWDRGKVPQLWDAFPPLSKSHHQSCLEF